MTLTIDEIKDLPDKIRDTYIDRLQIHKEKDLSEKIKIKKNYKNYKALEEPMEDIFGYLGRATQEYT